MNELIRNTLMSLLALDGCLYAGTDWVSALEQLAWLGLLFLLDAEVRFHLTAFRLRILQAIRGGLGLLILGVFVSHVLHTDGLDTLNTLLWFAIVISMELEIRFPPGSKKARRLQTVHNGVLLPGLVLMVGLWSWQAAWLDAWDALLWLAAYVILERDIRAAPTLSEKC